MADYPMPAWLNQAPNYGELALGRARLQLAANEQAQQAYNAQQVMQMQQAKLQQDAVQFDAQLALKQQELKAQTDAQLQKLHQDSLLKQQEMEIAKAYNSARIGLTAQQQQNTMAMGQARLQNDVLRLAQQQMYNTGRLDIQKGGLDVSRARLAETLQQHELATQRGQQFSKMVQDAMTADPKLTLPEAYRSTLMRHGAELQMPVGMYSGINSGGGGGDVQAGYITLEDGRRVPYLHNNNRFQVMPMTPGIPNVTTIAPNLIRIVDPNTGKVTIRSVTPFKFSKQPALDKLIGGVNNVYLDPDYKPQGDMDRQYMKSTRKQYDDLIKERDDELKRWESQFLKKEIPQAAKLPPGLTNSSTGMTNFNLTSDPLTNAQLAAQNFVPTNAPGTNVMRRFRWDPTNNDYIR